MLIKKNSYEVFFLFVFLCIKELSYIQYSNDRPTAVNNTTLLVCLYVIWALVYNVKIFHICTDVVM